MRCLLLLLVPWVLVGCADLGPALQRVDSILEGIERKIDNPESRAELKADLSDVRAAIGVLQDDRKPWYETGGEIALGILMSLLGLGGVYAGGRGGLAVVGAIGRRIKGGKQA